MTRREPYEWQEKDILGFLENDLTGLNASQPGAGKGHPLDEPILTPNGWVPVGNLQPGDEVVGSDGNPTRVLDVYDRGILPVYRVTFRDGASVRVDGDHLWRVYVSSGRTYVRSTKSLTGLSGLGIYSIPTTQVTHPTAELPIDPYALGALIADGYLHGSGLTWTKNEVAVVDEMRLAVARSGGVLTDHKVFAARRYGVTGLSGTVNRLGLKVGSADKFIPAEYLTASVEQRLALVHGLFDGDGSVRSDRGTAHYTTISDRLADDVLQLLWSLGVFATKYRTNHPRGSYWVITVHGGFNPFGVSEQRNRVTGTTRPFKRSFKSIELESNEPVRCIRVEAADSLYITKDYIVTHNTLTTVEAAHRAGTDVNLIIAPDSTHATAWGPTVLGQTDQELRVVGNKNKATQSALFDLEFGHPGWYALTPQLFTRMDISQLYPDLLIVDECFVGGTLIETPNGAKPIEDIRAGDYVLGYDHATGATVVTRVTDTMSKRAAGVMPNGATPNHPYFVDGVGYLPLADITEQDYVYEIDSDQEVRSVRANVLGIFKAPERPDVLPEVLRHSERPVPEEGDHENLPRVSSDVHTERCSNGDLREVLCSEKAPERPPTHRDIFARRPEEVARVGGQGSSFRADGGSVAETGVQGIGSEPNDGSEPCAYPGGPREDTTVEDRPWRHIPTSDGWKWVGSPCGATYEGLTTPGLGDAIFDRDGGRMPQKGVPPSLQGGSGPSGLEASHRGGRAEPQVGVSGGAGPEETAGSFREGVDYLAILEPRSVERYRIVSAGSRGGGGAIVYNLTTESSNYFASRVLVHNCHQLSKQKSKGQRKLSGYAPKRDKPISKQVGAVMALSGTPFRNDFQRAWSVTRLLWPELSGFGQIATPNTTDGAGTG